MGLPSGRFFSAAWPPGLAQASGGAAAIPPPARRGSADDRACKDSGDVTPPPARRGPAWSRPRVARVTQPATESRDTTTSARRARGEIAEMLMGPPGRAL